MTILVLFEENEVNDKDIYTYTVVLNSNSTRSGVFTKYNPPLQRFFPKNKGGVIFSHPNFLKVFLKKNFRRRFSPAIRRGIIFKGVIFGEYS